MSRPARPAGRTGGTGGTAGTSSRPAPRRRGDRTVVVYEYTPPRAAPGTRLRCTPTTSAETRCAVPTFRNTRMCLHARCTAGARALSGRRSSLAVTTDPRCLPRRPRPRYCPSPRRRSNSRPSGRSRAGCARRSTGIGVRRRRWRQQHNSQIRHDTAGRCTPHKSRCCRQHTYSGVRRGAPEPFATSSARCWGPARPRGPPPGGGGVGASRWRPHTMG